MLGREDPPARTHTARPVALPYHLLAQQGQCGVQVGRLSRQRRAPGPAATRAPAAQLVLDARLLRVQPLQVPPAPRRAAAGRRVQQPTQALGQRGQPVHPQPSRACPAHRAGPATRPPAAARPRIPPSPPRPLPGGAPPTSRPARAPPPRAPPARSASSPAHLPRARPPAPGSPPTPPTSRLLSPELAELTSSPSPDDPLTCPRSSGHEALPRLPHCRPGGLPDQPLRLLVITEGAPLQMRPDEADGAGDGGTEVTTRSSWTPARTSWRCSGFRPRLLSRLTEVWPRDPRLPTVGGIQTCHREGLLGTWAVQPRTVSGPLWDLKTNVSLSLAINTRAILDGNVRKVREKD